MKEFYNIKYYTLNLIPKYRCDYITLRLNWFIQLLGLKNSDWPLDCTNLLKKICDSRLVPLQYGFFELSNKYDAFTEYKPEFNVYLMLLNKNKVNYPFEHSHDRRLNFTLAHELAHIALGHLLIPRGTKTEEEKELEEIEADEFAGKLLMPESLIFSCNFYSLDAAAEYFKVSKSALWKRLNNMKRLDVIHSRKISSCPECGNTHFSPFAEYCGICGHAISENQKGIRREYYPEEIHLDNYKRVIECPVCKSKTFHGDKCSRCGTYIFNYCTSHLSEDAACENANLGNSRFCEMCGKPTYFFKKGLLKPWHDGFDNLCCSHL